MSNRWCKSAAQSYLLPLVFEGTLLISGTILWNLRAPYLELSQRFLRLQKLRERYRPSPQSAPASGVMDRTWWSGNYFVTCRFDNETCSAVVPEEAVRRLAA